MAAWAAAAFGPARSTGAAAERSIIRRPSSSFSRSRGRPASISMRKPESGPEPRLGSGLVAFSRSGSEPFNRWTEVTAG